MSGIAGKDERGISFADPENPDELLVSQFGNVLINEKNEFLVSG